MNALTKPILETPPEHLCRIDGVAGILMQQNGYICMNEMPLDSEQGNRLAECVQKMCEGYRASRRILRQVIITYPCGIILIHSYEDAQLVLLLLDDTAIDAASFAAGEYLRDRFKRRLRLPLPPAA
jgi:hypothetical protein